MSDFTALERKINQAWEQRQNLPPGTQTTVRDAVDLVIDALDAGQLRVAEKTGAEWTVHEWVKKAVLLYFQVNEMTLMQGGIRHRQKGENSWYDKVPLKFSGWDAPLFGKAGFRAVPGSLARRGAYVAKGVVLMPCFINIGAYVDEGTMIDTWSTVGSCAQIGKRCHISGGVGIGGVLEPLQAKPVIIEDDVFIGARSEVAEGVIVEQGAVLSMGVYVGASTKIVDRATGEIHYGRVPAYSVVVPGTLPPSTNRPGDPSLYCAVIVKKVDAQTRSKTAINELLRS